MSAKPDSLRSLIGSDVRAKAEWVYGDASRRNLLKAWFTDGTASMILYRLMQWCQGHRLPVAAMFFNKWNSVFAHCVIGRGADFGAGFVLIHSHGVVINSAVKGGRNIKLEHGVTIGAERLVSPVLGDAVFVGAGAKIIGNVRIGTGAKIGANAVVVKDVPPGATAIGVPAKIVEGVGQAPTRGKEATD